MSVSVNVNIGDNNNVSINEHFKWRSFPIEHDRYYILIVDSESGEFSANSLFDKILRVFPDDIREYKKGETKLLQVPKTPEMFWNCRGQKPVESIFPQKTLTIKCNERSKSSWEDTRKLLDIIDFKTEISHVLMMGKMNQISPSLLENFDMIFFISSVDASEYLGKRVKVAINGDVKITSPIVVDLTKEKTEISFYF